MTARRRAVVTAVVALFAGVIAAASVWSGWRSGDDFDTRQYICIVAFAAAGAGFVTSRIVAQYGGIR